MSAELYAHADRRSLAWAPTVGFSQSVVTNAPVVFTSGQGPFGDDGSLVGEGDPAAQIRRTFENLRTVLEAAGASLDSVLTMTVYLARAEDFDLFRQIRAETFGEPYPAVTTLRGELLEPGMLVELNATAAVGVARAEP
jgi:2-iminobutanoate/2-iminopropanoate deaminase